MKTCKFPLFVLIQLFLNSLLLDTFAQAGVSNLESDPHRGVYVDRFVSLNSEDNSYSPYFSMLGSDLDHDGIFEKEDEFLQYCQDNHITSILLYDLRKLIGAGRLAWDENRGCMLDLEEHLCRFINKARNEYCITEINASESNSYYREFNFMSDFITAPVLLPAQFKSSPSFDPMLLIMEDSTLVPGDPLFQKSELMKYYFRAANLNRRTSCGAYFNYLHVEYEFFHNKDDDFVRDARFTYDLTCNKYICPDDITVPPLGTPNPPDLFGRMIQDPSNPTQMICQPCGTTTYPSKLAAKYFSHFKPTVRALRSLVDNYNTSNGLIETDDRFLRTQAYLTYMNLSDNQGEYFESRGDYERFMDGVSDYDLTSISSCPQIEHSTSVRHLDRLMPYHFKEYDPGDIVLDYDDNMQNVFFNDLNNYNTHHKGTQLYTDIHPILNAEKMSLGGYADYLGLWLDEHYTNNIFEAEKDFYQNWVGNRRIATENDFHPGGFHWFTQSYMTNELSAPRIFYWDQIDCMMDANIDVTFHYIGPTEELLQVDFWISDLSGTIIVPVQTDYTHSTLQTYPLVVYEPPIWQFALTDKVVSLSNNFNTLSPYIVHMKVIYPGGCEYEYTDLVNVNSAPVITATGPLEFCEGDQVTLRASGSATASYKWFKNNVEIAGAINMEYIVKEQGLYHCEVTSTSCGSQISINDIFVTVKQKPWVGIFQDCSDHTLPITLHVGPMAASASSSNQNPYGATYLWSTGETTSSIEANEEDRYYLLTTFPNGCTRVDRKVVDEDSEYNHSFTVSAVTDATSSCTTNGSFIINLDAVPKSPIFVVLTNGIESRYEHWPEPFDTGPNAGHRPQNHLITNLAPGTYEVFISTWSPCHSTQSSLITIGPLPSSVLSANISTQNAACFGEESGIIYINSISGGAGPYQLEIPSLGVHNLIVSNTYTINDVPAGTYYIRITDFPASGCSGFMQAIATITQPDALVPMLSSGDVSNCQRSSNGSATLLNPNDFASYVWSTTETTVSISDLVTGTYDIVVTNSSGCIGTNFIHVGGPPEIEIILDNSSTQVLGCGGSANGTIRFNIYGGEPPYNISSTSPDPFMMSPDGKSASIVATTARTYNLIIEDNLGCTATVAYTISSFDLTFQTTDVTCNGGSDGSVEVIPSGGTAPYTYLWCNGSVSSTLSGQNVNSNCLVTVTDANGCEASSSDYAIVEPSEVPVTYAVTDVSCYGGNDGTVSIGLVAGYTYFWPHNSSPNRTLSGLSSGLYNCVVTDVNSCTRSVSINISQPSQLSITITSPQIGCLNSNKSALFANINGGSGPYAFLWSNSQITQQTTAILAPGTYSVVVTDDNGCTSSASKAVIEDVNCCGNGVEFIFTQGAPASDTYHLNSNLTLTGDLTIQGSDISIASGVGIIIPPNFKLTIEQSVLHACDNLWQGIILSDPSSSLIVINGSTIQDAAIGVDASNDATVEIYNSTFSNNIVGVSLKFGAFSNFISDGTNYLYSTGAVIPAAGINLQDVTNVTIGSSTYGTNNFIALRNGIFSQSSNLTVQNCTFQGQGTISRGINISSNDASRYQLTLGGSTADGCTFIDCGHGVFSSGGMEINASFNNFDNIGYMNQGPTYGIRVLNSASRSSTITDNVFDRQDFGVWIHNTNNASLIIKDNLFNDFNYLPVRQGDRAITVWNAIPLTVSYSKEITRNTIKHYQRGIGLTFQTKTLVKDNTVLFDDSNPWSMWYGLRVLEGSDNDIIHNYVNRTLPFPDLGISRSIFGLTIERSPNNLVSENEIYNLGSGIRFYNTQTNTVRCNQMYFNVDNLVTESSIIGDQGSVNDASDNIWAINPKTEQTTQDHGNILGLGNLVSPAPVFYVQNLSGFDPSNGGLIVCPNICPFDVAQVVYTISTSSCTNNACSDPDCIQELIARIIEEQAEYANLEDEQSEEARQYAFELLLQDSMLMHQGTLLDAILQDFYQQMQSGNSGVLEEIINLLNSEENSGAIVANSHLTPENLSESNLQLFNEIYVETWGENNYILDSYQISILEFIAYQNPYTGGDAVYSSRVMLGLDIADFMVEPFERKGKKHVESTNFDNGIVVPNPNTGKMSYIYKLEPESNSRMRIFNSRGILIRNYQLYPEKNSIEIDLSDQPNGIYIYSVITNGYIYSGNKIVIQK